MALWLNTEPGKLNIPIITFLLILLKQKGVMATKIKVKSNGKFSDKELNRLLIEQKLETALSDLKPLVSKKKFERSLKKASKQLNKEFSKKSLNSLRKQNSAPPQPETETRDNTSLLIEELP